MALDFPTPTTVGQIFTQGSLTYIWDGTKWVGQAPAAVVQSKIEKGNTSAEVVDNGSDGHFKVTAEGAEKLRVGPAGQIGIAGANYGTSGMFLTSGGPSGAISWTTPPTPPAGVSLGLAIALG